MPSNESGLIVLRYRVSTAWVSGAAEIQECQLSLKRREISQKVTSFVL